MPNLGLRDKWKLEPPKRFSLIEIISYLGNGNIHYPLFACVSNTLIMDTPLIFFAYANDADDHLNLLKEESRMLFRALEELDRKEYIKIYREESAQSKDIFDGFTRYKDRVAIFHYGGHANGTHLRLDEGASDARGLAQLMGEQENLKLVFLNGCSSKGQVQTLFDAGVKAVIATSVPIEDRKATEFAEQFYEALAHKRTIGQAFNIAQAYLTTRYGDSVDVSYRDFMMDFSAISEEVEDTGEIPWGLYIKEEHREEILHYKLPYYRPIGLPKDMIQYIGKSFTANRFIILVLDEMCKYNPDIYAQMVEQRGEETVKKDSRHYPGLIIENFPWPIGSQIRLLRLYDKPNIERLEHLLSTYIITSQVLYYILLSDLWEQSRLTASKTSWKALKKSKPDYAKMDFLGQILPLFKQVSEVGVPFISEYEMLVKALEQKENPINKAHAFLEDLRAKMASDPPSSDLDKLCQKTEQAVSLILRSASFLAGYRMLTVRNIMVDRPRFETLSYELDMGPLNAAQGIDLNLYQDAAFRRKNSFTDSYSVILVDNENKIDQSLNLSPFIIDKNTFVQMKKSETTEQDKLAHIFLLAWEEEEKLYYTAVEHSFFTALEKESDQIHTHMSMEDFTEGRNLKKEEEEDDFGFDFGFDDDSEVEESTDEGAKVFQLLQDQYDMLKADLT